MRSGSGRIRRWSLVLGTTAAVMVALALTPLLAHPVHLAFLDEPIAAAIRGAAPGLTVALDGTALVRSGRGVALQVSGLHLATADGTPLVSLPALRVRPSFGALLRGRLVIARVDVEGAELAFGRDADGAWTIDAGGEAGVAVAGLLGSPGSARAATPLPRIAFARTHVTLADARAGVTLDVADATLVLSPAPERVGATLAGVLDVAGTAAPLQGRLRLPVRAELAAARAADGSFGDVTIALTGDAGELRPGADAGPPFALADVAARATYLPAVDTLRFERLKAGLGSSRVAATSTLIFGTAPLVVLDGTVDVVEFADVVRFWPRQLASAVRSWLAARVRTGVLRSCRVRLGVHPAPPAEAAARGDAAAATPDAVDVACDFSDVTTDYLPPLDPIRAASGSAHLTADRLDVTVKSGALGATRVDGGTLAMDLTVDPPRAAIAADVSGKTADVLAVVARPPLAFAPPLGIAAADVGGESRVHAELELPIATDVGAAAVAVTATADLTAVELPPLVAGVGLRDGRLTVRVDGRTVDVSGSSTLTGIPAVTTPVQLAVRVSPSDGGTARATIAVDGDDLHARAGARFSDAGLASLDVERLRFRGTDLGGTLRRSAAGDYEASLAGASLDLATLLATQPVVAGDVASGNAMYTLDLRVDRVRTARDVEIRGLRGSVQSRGGRLAALTVSGTLAPKGEFSASLADGAGKRPMTVTSGDAGRLLRAVAGLEQIDGGTLALDAATDERGPLASLAGELVLRDFKVVRAPVLTKLLGIGSLGGIAALVQGEGLPIGEARFPFRWDGSRLALHDVRAIGAIGLTADGAIDRDAGTCDLRGNIIPAYSLNSALGRVPLLGRLFVGQPGGGVFGIDFRVQGAVADPKVEVNPLRSVAPTVLRSWFVDPFAPGSGQKRR